MTLSGASILQEAAERGDTCFRLTLWPEASFLATVRFPFVFGEALCCRPVFRAAAGGGLIFLLTLWCRSVVGAWRHSSHILVEAVRCGAAVPVVPRCGFAPWTSLR